MNLKNVKFYFLGLLALVVFACRPDNVPQPPAPQTEWISRADGFLQQTTLQMVAY